MDTYLEQSREAAWKKSQFYKDYGDDPLSVWVKDMKAVWLAAYDAGVAAQAERVRALVEALEHIRDMPVYDQDDHVRIRDAAKRFVERYGETK